jgi:putative restriction endonuclease
MRIFGHIDGIPVEASFPDRRALLEEAGVHRQLQAGIAGSATEGADSIVVSGGYEDDDFGDLIIYSGQGGNDQRPSGRWTTSSLSWVTRR